MCVCVCVCVIILFIIVFYFTFLFFLLFDFAFVYVHGDIVILNSFTTYGRFLQIHQSDAAISLYNITVSDYLNSSSYCNQPETPVPHIRKTY